MHFATLKLLPLTVAAGDWHMACDRQMLRDSQGDAPDTLRLRFYQWQPAALSLGANQHHYPPHWQELALQEGIDIVRRPTGGRAVLHDGDLTYALTCYVGDRPRREVYFQLCQFLIHGLAQVGLALQFGSASRPGSHQPSCFATATWADLVLPDGQKILGSAQRYEQGWVLQHGSLVLTPNGDRHRRFFPGVPPPVGWGDSLVPSAAAVAEVLTNAARACFGCTQVVPLAPPAGREDPGYDGWDEDFRNRHAATQNDPDPALA
jgi:lipoate-protein ligase A